MGFRIKDSESSELRVYGCDFRDFTLDEGPGLGAGVRSVGCRVKDSGFEA